MVFVNIMTNLENIVKHPLMAICIITAAFGLIGVGIVEGQAGSHAGDHIAVVGVMVMFVGVAVVFARADW